MPLTLLQNNGIVGNTFGLTVPFAASGGVAPYTYTVAFGNSNGVIDSTTGLYTVGGKVGVDTIQVTDSTTPTPLVALGSVIVVTPLQLVADIIRQGLGLAQDQVYVYDQKYDIPPDDRIYVAVGIDSLKPFGNRPKIQPDGTTLQSVNIQAMVSIHVLSRSTKLLFTKESVFLALSSQYAENAMTLSAFQVASLSTSFIDVSEIDGAAIPYHYRATVSLQYAYTGLQSNPYYDTFAIPQVVADIGSYPVVPGFPGSFKIIATSSTNTTATLAWSPSYSAGQYRVLRGSVSGVWTTVVGTTTSNQYTDTGLTTGVTYYYQVVAVNPTGETLSDVQAVIAPALPVPGPFSITSAVAGNAEVTISWGMSMYASSYNVVRGDVSGSWPTTVDRNATSPYVDETVVNGNVYYYQVVAKNATGSTYAVQEAVATPLLPAPGSFDITSTVGGPGVITISWGVASDAVSYDVFRGTESGSWPDSVGTNVTSGFGDTSVVAGTEYFYKVVAINPSGSTPSSNEGSATASSAYQNLDSGIFQQDVASMLIGPYSDINFNGSSPFSLSLWVLRKGINGGTLLNNLQGALNGVALLYNTAGQPEFYVMQSYPGNALGMYSLEVGFDINAWNYFTVTYNGNKDVSGCKMYKNGVQMGSIGMIVNTLTGSSSSTAPWSVAQNRGATFEVSFDGQMDEIAFWNTELSADSVLAQYNGGTPTDLSTDPNVAALLAWYRFEPELSPPDTSTEVFDRANSNDATATSLTFSTDVP